MNSSKLKNKIQSNNGATLVFALVALIFCVMVAAVVIYTAFSNVGRVKNTQSEEQNYLSVSSAVMMFKDLLEGDSVSYKEILINTTEEVYDENWEQLLSEPAISKETTFGDAVYYDALPRDDILTLPWNDILEEDILEEVLKEWAKMIDSPVPVEQTLDITITGDSNLPQIAPVEAKMVFDPQNKKITITFGIEDASPSTVMTMDLAKDTSYPVTTSSEMKEQKNGKNVKTITITKEFVHTISWDNCVITKKN